jgi:hypothetical protein
MAFKMKNPIGNVASTKSHGTNANYKKSGMKNADGSPVKPGAPGLLGKIMDPLGIFKKGKQLLGGKGKCPPAAAGAPPPADGAVTPPVPPTPAAQGAAVPADEQAGPVVDPAAAAPMKEGLMTGPKAKKKKERKLKDQKIKRMDYIPKPPKEDKATTRKEWMRNNAPKKDGAPMKASPAKSDKPKHQKGGSYTYKGKTYPDFAHLPDAAKQVIYAKNAPNPELAKKAYGIEDENRDTTANNKNK